MCFENNLLNFWYMNGSLVLSQLKMQPYFPARGFDGTDNAYEQVKRITRTPAFG